MNPPDPSARPQELPRASAASGLPGAPPSAPTITPAASAMMCAACSYELQGLATGVPCPECGALERSPVKPAGFGGVAGRGLLWMIPNVALSKLMSIAAQLVLALMLTQSDFGVYGIALSIAMFVQTMRDGGVRELLIQQPARYRELEGRTFWLALTVNIVVALLLGLTGEVIGVIYTHTGFLHRPSELSTLVWIMGSSVPIGTVSAMLSARMRIDLRFKAMSIMTTISSMIRYGGQIVLALAGLGAMSIVLPMVAIAVFEGIFAFWLTREKPWMRPPEFRSWPGMLRQTKWIVLSSIATGVTSQGYTLIAGAFMPADLVGIYFFAVQLHMQIENLISFSLMQVMFPVLARLNDDRPRQADAALRVTRAVMLLTAPACAGLVLVYPEVEQVLFNGKWATALVPLAILAFAYPIRAIFVGVPSPLLQAQGRFKDYFWMWAINGIGLTIVTAAGARFLGTPAGIAVFVAGFMIVTGLFSSARVLHSVGVPFARSLPAMLQTYIIGLALGAAALALDHYVTGPRLESAITASFHISSRVVQVSSLVRASLVGVVYALTYGLAVRLAVPSHLKDLLAVAPKRAAGLARRILLLA